MTILISAAKQKSIKIFLTSVGLALLASACAQIKNKPASPIGSWQNITNGDRIELNLINETECEIVIERTFKKSNRRLCKYEPYQDRYLVFLVQKNGMCGSQADFEFHFDPDSPLVDLYVGATPITMHKQP